MSAARGKMREIMVAHPLVGRRAIDHDAGDVLGQKIAHRAFDQVRFLENAAGGRLGFNLLLDFVPLFQEHGQVQDEITRFCWPSPAVRMMTPMPSGRLISRRIFFRRWRSSGVLDLARNAALVGIGQEHQEAAGQHQIGRHARPFGANGAFGDLHDNLAAGRIKARDVLLRNAGTLAPFGLAPLDHFDAAVKTGGNDVPVVEKGVFLEADIHKGRLEAVLQVAHLALEDAADQALLGGALDGEFLQASVLLQGDARFEGFGVDDDFLVRLPLPVSAGIS